MWSRVQSTNLLLTKIKNVTNALFTRYVHRCTDQVTLTIKGEELRFPNVWLRDNCQCPNCFHPSAKSRIIDWTTFNLNIRYNTIQTSDNTVKITWDDGHESVFNTSWLQLRSFTPHHQKRYMDTIYKPTKTSWNKDMFHKVCSKHDYNAILNSDQALYKWLHNLSVYGVAIIENAPDEDKAIDKVVEKIGFPKQTHYGVKFIVENVPNTSNVAYLSNDLPLHVDLPYYEYHPGVNMLHCLVQTAGFGGDNLLSDGHHIAQHIKENHPKQYKLLTEIDVEWSDVGTEHGNQFYKLHCEPVICVDKDGQIKRINFSIPQRGCHFTCDIDLIKPWYEAHDLFFRLGKEFSANFKTQAGQILTFDNIRLLHGRSKYTDSTDNRRKLIGAYVDWDEVYSRLRCLKVKLHKNEGILNDV